MKDNAGLCPVMHGGNTTGNAGTTNPDWWRDDFITAWRKWIGFTEIGVGVHERCAITAAGSLFARTPRSRIHLTRDRFPTACIHQMEHSG